MSIVIQNQRLTSYTLQTNLISGSVSIAAPTIPETAIPDILNASANLQFMAGNGKHGSIILASNGTSTIANLITWNATTLEYSLSNDLEANNLQINDNVQLNVNGWRVFVYQTLTLGSNAIIHSNGSVGSLNTAGVGALPATTNISAFCGGSSGGNGCNVTNAAATGVSATVISGPVRIGGAGGAGGQVTNSVGGTSAGGSGAAGSNWQDYLHGTMSAVIGPLASAANNLKIAGGSGGGGGAGRGTNTAKGGGGGGGGGIVVVTASNAYIGTNAKIQANGAEGVAGSGSATLSQAGGGGGGGGGAIFVNITKITSGTLQIEAKGGNGGNARATTAGAGYTNIWGGDGGNGGYIEAFIGTGSFTTTVSGGVSGSCAFTTGGSLMTGSNGSAGTSYEITL